MSSTSKDGQALAPISAHGANAPRSVSRQVKDESKILLATTAPKTRDLQPVGSLQESIPKSDLDSGGLTQGRGKGNRAANIFQIRARAKSVVYVIDRSVSMGPNGKLAWAKEEFLSSLKQLPPETEFQIILFNRSVDVLTTARARGLLPATLENKFRIAKFLKSVLPEGGTQPVPALKRALALKPDVIFFLTDAEDMSQREVREVTLLNRGHTAIHVVTFGDGDYGNLTSPLYLLAQNNRGGFRMISAAFESRPSLSGN